MLALCDGRARGALRDHGRRAWDSPTLHDGKVQEARRNDVLVRFRPDSNKSVNLLAPSRLIYPVYTVYRNKFPRPPGQGASLIERLFTGISGSQTGGQGVLDVSIPELVQNNGTFGTWPLNLPGAGSQTEVTLNVPFRFFGITEQLSWLAQFAGQGYEDISALANLIMLQEMMLG